MSLHGTKGTWLWLLVSILLNTLAGAQFGVAAEVGPNDFRISAAAADTSYYRPAVVYNATDGEYLVVYPKLDMDPAIPAADWDQEVFGRFVNVDGSLQGNEFQISNMSVAQCWAEFPSVAWDSVEQPVSRGLGRRAGARRRRDLRSPL